MGWENPTIRYWRTLERVFPRMWIANIRVQCSWAAAGRICNLKNVELEL
jgi:hypothetical protein